MKLDHVSIMVGSLENSIPYYEHLLPLLGFCKLRDHVWRNDAGVFLQFREAQPGTSPYERYGAGMNHLGFSAPSAQTLQDIRAAMLDAGFPVPEIQIMNTVNALFMKDPDGIRFEISYYPPGINPVE